MNPADMRLRLRNYARLQPGKQWFRVVNQASGSATDVMIYDEIGFFGVTAQDLIGQLDGIDTPLNVYVNSPGGEIFDGIAIYNALLRHQDVSVYIDGIAASAASFIAQAASPGKLGMAKNSKMMLHNGQAMAAGDAKELRRYAEILDAETANIASIYADRSGRPASDFLAMMDKETWLSAQDAVKEGLADYAYDPRRGPSNILWRREDFKNVSDGNQGWIQRDGEWVFDPEDDGDDDYRASTDTDHDYWTEDGKQLKSIPASPDGKQPAKPMPANALESYAAGLAAGTNDHWNRPRNAADVDSSAWDGSKAMANGSASDDPAAFFKAICAAEHTTGSPDAQTHWALPYKYTPSSPPNKAGVTAALAALNGARGGVKDLKDPAGAKSKLEGIMKEINPDWEPSDEVYLGQFLSQFLRGGK